jgi:transcription antitermination factor NusG
MSLNGMDTDPEQGQRVRITSGVFADASGDVLELLGEGRITVRIVVAGHQVPVEVDRWIVEPVDASA